MKNKLKINTQKSRRKSRRQKGKVIKRGKNLNRESGQKHYKLQLSKIETTGCILKPLTLSVWRELMISFKGLNNL